MNYAELQKEITNKVLDGIDKDEIIKFIDANIDDTLDYKNSIMYMDGMYSQFQIAKQIKSDYQNYCFMSILLILLGLFLSFSSFMIGTTKFVICIGLILSGIVGFISSFKNYKKPITDHITHRSVIKQKRIKLK